MDKFLKILYCDTNVLVKFLLPKEKGSDIIKDLALKESYDNYTLYTSQTAIYEVQSVLKRKVNQPKGHHDYITKKQYSLALHRLRKTLRQVFKVIDERKARRDPQIHYSELICGSSLRDRDARHVATILNHLSFFDGVKFVSSDRKLNKFIKKAGYEIIDPEKISKEDLRNLISGEEK